MNKEKMKFLFFIMCFFASCASGEVVKGVIISTPDYLQLKADIAEIKKLLVGISTAPVRLEYHEQMQVSISPQEHGLLDGATMYVMVDSCGTYKLMMSGAK